jgi:hypothetical protein
MSRSADEDDEEWRTCPPAAQGATMLHSINWVAKRLLSENIVCLAHLIRLFLAAWKKKPTGGMTEEKEERAETAWKKYSVSVVSLH